MKNTRKSFFLYLFTSFLIAWILQIIASTIGKEYSQIILAISMFAPMVGVLISNGGLSSNKTRIGWKINFRKNWKHLIIAWFLPMMLTVLGAILYFIVFPKQFDLNCGYIANIVKSTGVQIENGEIQELSMLSLAASSSIQAVTLAPLINALFAVGEEAGWRGYMTPILVKHIGKRKALLISGVIWGIWHAPLIALIGYEYGFGYWGAPLSGIILFCLITTALGIILSWLYNKTNSIWIPAIFHGAFNAVATAPLYFTDGTLTQYILGPTPVGLLAGLPLIFLSLILFISSHSTNS